MTNPVQTLKALSEHSQDVEQAHAAVSAEILQSIEESKRLLTCLRNCLTAVERHFAVSPKFRVNLPPAPFGKDEVAEGMRRMNHNFVTTMGCADIYSPTKKQCAPHSESEFFIHEAAYLDAISFLSPWGLTLVPSPTRVSYFSVGVPD